MEKYTEILSKVDGVFFLIKTLEEDPKSRERALSGAEPRQNPQALQKNECLFYRK